MHPCIACGREAAEHAVSHVHDLDIYTGAGESLCKKNIQLQLPEVMTYAQWHLAYLLRDERLLIIYALVEFACHEE